MTVLVSQAAGCIITTTEDEYALINAQWDLKTTAGASLSCPPNTNTAAVYAQAVDTSFRLVGSPFIDLYDCNAGGGVTDPLPPDVYQVWVELTSGSGGTVYASSTTLNEASPTDEYFVNVLDVDQTWATTILSDGGYFQFDWDLRNAANQPITCASVPKVALFSVDVNDATHAFDDRFPCDKQYGLSLGLLQGGWKVDVTAINASGQGLGPATPVGTRAIQGPNKVTDLGTVMVRVD
jgi:hypothetical protein